MAGELNLESYQALLAEQGMETPSLEAYQQLLSPAPKRGPLANTRYTGQAAMIAGNPYEVDELHNAAASEDTRAYLRARSAEWYEQRAQDAAARLSETQFASSDAMLEAAMSEQERIDKIRKGVAHPVADEAAYATNAALQGDVELVARQAVDVALANELVELTENSSFAEKLADFGSFLIPFKFTADIQDIDDQVKADPRLADIAGDDIETIVGAWKGLPPERQAELVTPLKEAIMRATESFGWTDGNATKTAGLLASFFDVDPAANIAAEQTEDILFGVVDVTPVGAIRAMKPVEKLRSIKILRKAAQDSAQETGAAKVAAKAGDVDSAAKHTIASLMDENTAAALGTERADAAASAMPLETGEWFQRVVDDDALPSTVAEKMDSLLAKANGYARTLKEETDLMQVGLLNRSERNQVVKSFFEKMEDVSEDYLTENMQMDNLRIVKEDAKGFTYQYTLRDKSLPVAEGEKERLIVKSGEVQFKINDVTGKFSATVNDPAAASLVSRIVSPKAWARRTEEGDFNLEVARALQSDDLAAAYQAKVGEFLDWAVEPVSGPLQKGARDRVSDVLEAGDEFINPHTQVQGTVFSPQELAAGIDTPKGTVRLTDPREVEAYYRFRLYGDATFVNEQAVLRREKELAGMKDVRLNALGSPAGDVADAQASVDVSRAIGKPFDEVGQALASVRDKLGQGVWDNSLNRTVDLSEDYVRKVYDEGDVLVRLEKDWNTKGTGELDASGEFVQYARVPRKNINELPTNILNYRAGYVPKINEARFVVSQRVPLIARNRPSLARSQALRAFDSLQDAKAFREEQVQRWMEKHGTTRDVAEELFPEPSLLDEGLGAARLEDAVGAHSGLYHATRSKDELLFGLSGQKLSRVSPLEAFQRHSAHLGAFISQNEVRIAREKRWLNTIREEFKDIAVRGFDDTTLPNTPKGKAAERVRQQIKEWNNIPSKEEELFDAMWQYLHDWALTGVRKLGYTDKESIKSMQWLMHANPYSAIKSAVMHNLLGIFNPAQLYTQASAMSVAIGKFPLKYTAAVLNDTGWFHILDNVRNNSTLGKVYNILLNGRAIDETTKSAYDAWRRTGLKEAVFNNSDMARITSNGGGLTSRILRSADFASLYLYRAGELAARRATFSAEFRAWSRRTGKTTPSDLELSEILEEVNKDMLELGPANRAFWQGGQGTGTIRQTMGVATQFMQVGAKTMELVLKNEGRGGFTAAQKRRIAMTQIGMFGAAGIPLGGVIAQMMAKGAGVEEAPQVVADTVNQGFVGLAGRLMFGDVEVSNRFALGAQTTETVRDFLTSDDPFWLKAMGPAGSGVAGRAWDSIRQLKPIMMADFQGNEELTDDAIILGAATLAQIPSSSRNWTKAWIMYNQNKILDTRKNVVVKKDFDVRTEMGVVLGFQPSAEMDTRMLQLDNRTVEEMIKDYADTRVALMHRAVYEMKLDPELVSSIERAYQVMDTAVPEYIAKKGRERAIERIYGPEGESKEEKELKKFVERIAPEKIAEDALLDSNNILQTGEKPFSQPWRNILDGTQVPQEDE